MHACAVQQRVEVTKSPEDRRDYRGLILANGVRALAVSDKETDKSAAAAVVGVGSLRDPRDWQGLAHFCEHMLFLGTEKQPEEDGYAKFISEHGGSNNAYTAEDHTCYYFDIAPPHLPEALDRFSQFFVCPLFSSSATEREVNAVHSEHTKNVPLDAWRQRQLEHELSNSRHDYSKFFTGSLDTLLPKPDMAGRLRQQLLNFHAEHYSANRLAVSVLGKQSLDELESLIANTFGQVVNKDLAENRWDSHPFDGTQCGVKVLLVPTKDIRSLQLVFPLPDYRQHYRGAPDRYVSHLVGHEGPGSVLKYLQEKGWSNALSAGSSGGGPGYDFFRVGLDLTEEGLENVDRVIATVFQYIEMLRQQGPQRWIFEEERDLENMSFRFKDKEVPANLVVRCSPKLLHYDLRDTLTARVVLHEFMPQLIAEILDKLRPEACKMFVSAKSLSELCDRTEPHYGVRYAVQTLTQQQLEAISGDTEAADRLHLPQANPFISTDFQLKPRITVSGNNSEQQQQQAPTPEVVLEEPGCRLWFSQDTEYLLPKCCYTFELMSPVANCEPLAAVSNHLYMALLQDALNSLTYDAELAGLSYHLVPSSHGAVLSFSGFNEKLPVLLQKVVERMRQPNIDEVRYRSVYDYYKRSLENFKLEQPYRHCLFNLSLICKDVVWTHKERLEALADTSLQSVLQFGSQLRSRLHTESLIFGNATSDEAKSIAKQLLAGLDSRRLRQSQIRRTRDTLLSSAGAGHCYRTTVLAHRASACVVYFQLQPCAGLQQQLLRQALTKLTVQILHEPFFDRLRTKEQLGYIVAAQELPGVSTEGIVLIVQSELHPRKVESRIDNFVDSQLPQLLDEMSDEEFRNNVEALDSVITEKPKKLASRNKKLHAEISAGSHCFDRADRLSHILRNNCDRSMLRRFYETWIDKNSPQRRRLALHAVSEETFGSVKEEDYEDYEPEIIRDVSQFKRLLPLGSLPPSVRFDAASGCVAKL